MTWTKILPTIDGYYWIHHDFGMTEIQYIYEDEYNPGEMWLGLGDSCKLEDYTQHSPIFYGPIDKPELSK